MHLKKQSSLTWRAWLLLINEVYRVAVQRVSVFVKISLATGILFLFMLGMGIELFSTSGVDGESIVECALLNIAVLGFVFTIPLFHLRLRTLRWFRVNEPVSGDDVTRGSATGWRAEPINEASPVWSLFISLPVACTMTACSCSSFWSPSSYYYSSCSSFARISSVRPLYTRGQTWVKPQLVLC